MLLIELAWRLGVEVRGVALSTTYFVLEACISYCHRPVSMTTRSTILLDKNTLKFSADRCMYSYVALFFFVRPPVPLLEQQCYSSSEPFLAWGLRLHVGREASVCRQHARPRACFLSRPHENMHTTTTVVRSCLRTLGKNVCALKGLAL